MQLQPNFSKIQFLRHLFAIFATVYLFVTPIQATYATTTECAALFEALSTKGSVELKDLPRARALRFFKSDPKNQLSFGLEAEINMRENPRVALFYRTPDLSEADWLVLPEANRIQLATEHNLKNLKAKKDTLAFVKLSGSPEVLPKTLTFEGNGNFEIHGQVFNTIFEAQEYIHLVTELFGKASWQGHVAFSNEPAVGAAGYAIFESDLAALSKLETGFNRLQTNPNFWPAKSFVHNSLGPLDELDRVVYIDSERQIGLGADISRGGKARTVMGTNFRGDTYGKGKSGFEVRSFHKDSMALIENMNQLAHILESGNLSQFSSFARMELIEPTLAEKYVGRKNLSLNKDNWNAFFKNISRFIHKDEDNILVGGAPYAERFFFPLREWSNHPALLALEPIELDRARGRIEKATKKYFKAIDEMTLSHFNTLALSAGALSPAIGIFRKLKNHLNKTKFKQVDSESVRQLLVALANWGHESGLDPILKSFKSRSFALAPQLPDDHTPELKRFFDELNTRIAGKFIAAAELQSIHNYPELIKNTIEVIYSANSGTWGHVRLRIGEKVYSFDGPRQTSISKFDPTKVKPDSISTLFLVGESSIKSTEFDIAQFYIGSEKYNVPPFDAYGSRIRIVKDKSGDGLHFETLTKELGAAPQFTAEKVYQRYLKTPDGRLTPLGGVDSSEIIGYSCSTSAAYILNQYFGISIPSDGARVQGEYIKSGHIGGLLRVQY